MVERVLPRVHRLLHFKLLVKLAMMAGGKREYTQFYSKFGFVKILKQINLTAKDNLIFILKITVSLF